MGFVYAAAATMFVVVSFLLVGLVLMQKGHGIGLLLGSHGGGVLGPAQARPFVAKLTAGLFGVLLVLAIALNLMAS